MDKITLGRVLWRSFFLQATWNYQGQQNLGIAAALLPALKKIHGSGNEATADALKRTLRPFNTQPYMAGPILGSLVKLEETGAKGGFTPDKLERYRIVLTTAFAAIGDAFYWNALLPAAAIIGLFWAVHAGLSGAAVFLIIYNIGHLLIRVWGFWLGYQMGLDMPRVLDRLHLPAMALRIRLISAGALGGLAALALNLGPLEEWTRLEYILAGLLAWPVVILLSKLIKKRLPVEVLIYSSLTGLLAWNWLVA